MKQLAMLSEKNQEFLKVNPALKFEGVTYYHASFWFKATDLKDVFEILAFDNLPQGLMDKLNTKE